MYWSSYYYGCTVVDRVHQNWEISVSYSLVPLITLKLVLKIIVPLTAFTWTTDGTEI